MKLNPGTPLSAAALCLSPLAINPATAGPLDHARRAAGGMLRETIFCLQSRDCGTDSSGFPLASLLRNFNLTAKVGYWGRTLSFVFSLLEYLEPYVAPLQFRVPQASSLRRIAGSGEQRTAVFLPRKARKSTKNNKCILP